MRTKAWSGLITNASPFALPAGAAVEQVNLATDIPGQLTSRGGMRPVAAIGPQQPLLDIYPFGHGGKTYVVGLTASGDLVALESPAYGDELATPQEPLLTVSASQVSVSYTHRFLSGPETGAAADTPVTPPESSLFITSLDGGVSGTVSWPYFANAENLCSGAGKESTFSGGTSATTVYPQILQPAQMCTTA
jgi:hypothetical protein